MTKAYMKLYTGDFLRKTSHLSPTEVGMYLRLIMWAWDHDGTIPTDKGMLSRITGCDIKTIHFFLPTVLQFWDVVDASTMSHERVSAELSCYKKKINNLKAAAAEREHNRTRNVAQSGTSSESESNRVAAKAAPDLTGDSPSVDSSLPLPKVPRRGRAPRTFMTANWLPSNEAITWCASEYSLTGNVVDRLIGEFRDHWLRKGEMGADWNAAFRNWVRKAVEWGKVPTGGAKVIGHPKIRGIQ
jgi:uncharacterized protein YdaU (DUF1376 family)